MKLSKRLLAVMMVVVMVLTLVPLSMFAFAEDPVEDGTAEHPYIINDYAELKDFLENLGKADYPTAGVTKYPNTKDTHYKLDGTFDADAAISTWLAAESTSVPGSTNGLVVAKQLSINYTPKSYNKARSTYDSSVTYYYIDSYEYNPDTGNLDLPIYAEDDTVTEGNYGEKYEDLYIKTPESWTPVTVDQLPANKKAEIATEIGLTFALSPSSEDFKGELDGNGKTLYGIVMSLANSSYSGLFMYNTGTIKNLTIENIKIDATTNSNALILVFGGLVGINTGTITNVVIKDSSITVTDDINSGLCIGGIAAMTGSNSVITNSSYSGTINYKLNSNAFTDTSKLATKDASNIAIGGITASNSIASDKLATQFAGNTSAVTLNSDFIGGVKFVANKMYPECKDTGSDITPALATAKKTVDAKDAALTDGDTSATDWSTNNYRAVKTTTNQYYIQHVVCGHSNSTHYDAVAPTCSATGKKEYWYCADCKTYYEGSEKPTKDSKNVTADSLVIDKDPANHKDSKGDSTLTGITKKTATCTEIGYNIPDSETYYYCTGCKKYYSDDTAATELQASDVEISKLPHSFTNYVYNNDATTAKDGTETAKCDNCTATNTRTKSGTRIPTVQIASTSKYEKDSGCIVTTLPSTKSGITVSEFKSNLSGSYTVRDENGNVVTSGVVKTGYTVEITGYPTSKMTIVVLGDVNKDGVISSLDYVRVKNIILKKFTPDAVTELAANANGDKKISSLDYVKIKNIILKSK